jgi:predicted ATPase/transcriptional regulator with XRE-family HTH domain
VAAFAELLLRHRRTAGWGQRELAERSGLSERAIRDLERGARTPRRHSVRAAATALGLTGDELAVFLAAARPPAAPAGGAGSEPVALPAAPPDDFVGRVTELRTLADLVAGGRHRLVTITGPAGVGKSRLAAELVAVLARRTTLEIHALDLSALREPDLVTELVAEVLGCGASRLRPVDRIAAQLGARRAIVVLDRLERLVAAAPDLAELIRRCAGLTLLATSQRPLHVRHERVVQLGPLPPAAAATLFVRRATAVRPGFAVTGTTAPVVAAICRRVDHLPLAIELAAARVRLLDVASLAERLDRRLAVLAGGARDLPERHRSLRAAIESSLEVVGPEAGRLFCWLGAFAGGGRLADLEAVVRALGQDESWLLAALAELVDTSLVRMLADGEASRYELPDAMAELASELIGADPDADRVWGAVAGRYLDLIRAAAAGTGRAITDRDSANVRAAVAWAVDAGSLAIDPPTIDAIFRHYETNSRLTEGQAVLCRIAVAGPALAWVRAGQMAALRGDLAEATRLGGRGLAELAPANLPARVSARMLLAQAAVEDRDVLAGRAHLRAALVDARRAGDMRLVGRVLNNLAATSAERGRLRDAERQAAAALAAKRRGGAGPVECGRSLFNLAELAVEAGHYERACAYAAEATELLSAAGFRALAAIATTTRALALLHLGRPRQALAAIEPVTGLPGAGDDQRAAAVVELRHSVILHAAGRHAEAAGVLRTALPPALDHTARDREQVVSVLELHAWLAARRAPATATALLGAGGRLRRRPVPEAIATMIDEVRHAGRVALGEDGFDRELRYGAGLHGQELIELCDRIGTGDPAPTVSRSR